MPTTRGRLVFNNLVVFDQADFFEADGFTRVVGIVPGQLVLEVFNDNISLPWPLASGAGITEPQITSGQVYWDILSLGSYGLRWRPNAIGYWRLILSYPAGSQILAQDYDVNSGTGIMAPGGGLKVSFVGASGKDDC
jgi:hypothetical protein